MKKTKNSNNLYTYIRNLKITKNSRGITLVALVVTIVVFLILAGVSINLVLGQNGLITKAQEAKRKTEEATANEISDMDKIAMKLEMYGNTQSSFEGGKWNETLCLCTPRLGTNMVGVYWSDGTKNNEGLYVASTTSTTVEVTSDLGTNDANISIHYNNRDWQNMYGDAIWETSGENLPKVNGAWNNDLAVIENFK